MEQVDKMTIPQNFLLDFAALRLCERIIITQRRKDAKSVCVRIQ